jgi:O-antigen biosynthesis protein WbqP
MIKRALDVAGAGAGLFLLLPLLLFLAVLVRRDSPGPALHWSSRFGRDNRLFLMPKFRTMRTDAPDMATEALEDPDRWITPAGRWLRRTSLDELPQLWSVLKGDLSLVGPRPPRAHEFARFTEFQRQKLAAQQGITCLWQVEGRHRISNFDDWVALDLEYIRNWSLWLDIKILFRTVGVVIRGTGV